MIRTCEICGKMFESSRHAKVCSDECRDARHSEKMREWYQDKKSERTCEYCGKTFLSRTGARFCGQSCRNAAIRANRKPEEKVYLTCPWCGEKFEQLDKRQIYCSKKCSARATAAERKRREEEEGFEHICIECGREYVSSSRNTWYCPECTESRKQGVKLETALYCTADKCSHRRDEGGIKGFCSKVGFCPYAVRKEVKR